jgi:hypothetical protein
MTSSRDRRCCCRCFSGTRSTSLGGDGGGDELVPGDERSQHEVLQRVPTRWKKRGELVAVGETVRP